jgi:hypothetical protein
MSAASPTMALAESPETVLRRVMDADEELLWAGRPDPVAGVGLPRAGERSRVLQLLVIAGAIGIGDWAIESGTIQVDLSWRAFMQAGGAIYIALAFLILVLRPILNRLGWGSEARHTRWARSQTDGITNRRLLVLVDGEIEHALGPDDFTQPLFGKSEYVNPKEKPFEEPTFVDRELSLDAWSVDTAYLSAAFVYRGEVSAETLAAARLTDEWRADDRYLYSRSEPTARLGYRYVAGPAGRISMVAIPDEGMLTLGEALAPLPTLAVGEALAPLPTLAVGDADARSIVEAAGGRVPETQIHWLFYTFFGLMLLIRPIARRFSALNDFTYAPFGKRVAMTASIAAVLTLAAGVAFPG